MIRDSIQHSDETAWDFEGISRFLVYTRVVFMLEARRSGRLPWFLGSTIRGALAEACRRLLCSSMDQLRCSGCALEFECPYAYLFETSVPPGSRRLRSFSTIPHPMIIEPLNPGGEFRAGERIRFAVTLFGKGIAHRKLLEIGVESMGFQGLGKRRIPFKLVDVTTHLSFPDPMTFPGKTTKEDIPVVAPDEVVVWFLTPTRLVKNNEILSQPDFRTLIRSILSRASAISYFHCGHELELNFKKILSDAESVTIKDADTQIYKLWRYSSRQRKSLPLTGVIGWVRFTGPEMQRFHPFLETGEILHVGKSTVHGLGIYKVFKPAISGRFNHETGTR